MKKLFPFIFLTIIGAIISLLHCLRYPLDADTAMMGVAGLATGIDPTLRHLGLSMLDPYYTEYLIGIPLQALGGNDPTMIKVTGYLWYLGLLAVFSALIYWLTHDCLKATIMAGVMTAMGLSSQLLMGFVLYHNLTIICAIVYLILFYKFGERPLWQQLILIVAYFPIVYSDMMFAALFALPLFIYSVYRAAKYHKYWCLVLSGAMCLMAVWTYLIKSGAPLYASRASSLNSLISIPGNFLDISIYMDSLVGPAIIVLIIVAFRWLMTGRPRVIDNERKNYALMMLGTASIIMFAGFFSVDVFTEPRFLLFPAIAVLVLGVLAMNQRDKFTLVFVVGAMVISILMNITYLANDPGAHDNTELIEYLKQNNLTYGYSDFLTSNPLTVLSRGDVKILGANIDDNITMLNYLNEKLWYSDRPAFILWPGEDMPGYVRAHQPDEILIYENFKIYVYNSSMKFS